MTAAPDLLAKVQTLSEERVAIVASLVDELAELQAREDAEDSATGTAALEEYRKTGEVITLDELEKQIGL
jgi:phage/plasmid-associated DNA primase